MDSPIRIQAEDGASSPCAAEVMAEVARRLGISVEATKSRLSRAREELRKRLEPPLRTRRYPEVILSKIIRKEEIA